MISPGLALLYSMVSLVVAAVAVRGAIAYAHRRGMLDQPGQRRSHTMPTPRGGGIGIVLAVLLLLPFCVATYAPGSSWMPWAAIWLGLLLVAVVGWWDDHRPLPVVPRLFAQAVAVALVAASLLVQGMAAWWVPPVLLAGVGSINLHNFMDGIDGLLAQQAAFVMLGFAGLALAASQGVALAVALVVAAASAGFWGYNRSPARIFMGDVGSGALGFLVFAIAASLWRADPRTIWPAGILCSAFLTDAGMTLAVRIWRGRRWYSAHREHLYQWMVRRGASHRTVAARYMAWNVMVCVPLALLAWTMGRTGWVACGLVYGVSMVAWMVLKQRCLRRVGEQES